MTATTVNPATPDGVDDDPRAGVTGDLMQKAAPVTAGALLQADDETGVVEALVSITGVVDAVNDIILPGAYKATLTRRKPKGIFCADEATEILTERGWLRYDEVTTSDRAYALDTDALTARFEPVLAVNVFPAEPRQARFIETSAFSSLTTMDHRWPVVRKGEPGVRWVTTASLSGSDNVLRALPNVDAPTEAKWTDAFVELVGWAWNEGHLGPQSRKIATPRLTITQSVTVNPTKCAAIRRALTSAFPGQWNEGAPRPSGAINFRLNRDATLAVASVLGPDKAPTAEFLLSLTHAQQRLLIDTCMAADGHEEPVGGTARWTQRSVHGAQAFEMLCALAGRPTNTRSVTAPNYPDRPYHVVTLAKRATMNPVKAVGESRRVAHLRPRVSVADEVVTHDGIVWCPTTPSGTWLARRNGSVYFTGNSHDWKRWVARTEHVEEWMPGDPRLPKETKDGTGWPAEAGALFVRCRFNLATQQGRDAYENVKFFSETGECEWSIGYQVPAGASTKDKAGRRHIRQVDLFEYSPVLFGAASLSTTMAVKSRQHAVEAGHAEPTDEDMAALEAEFGDALVAAEGLSWDDLDGLADPDDDEGEPVDGEKVAAAPEWDVEVKRAVPTAERRRLADEGAALPDGSFPIKTVEDLRNAVQAFGRTSPDKRARVRRHIIRRARALDALDALPDSWNVKGLDDDDLETKYDTSPVGTPGGRRNWVDDVGGLPTFIRAIAHALIRKGRSKQTAIQIAVATVKRWARGGGDVTAKTRAKAAKAVAEWEAKKARARADNKTSEGDVEVKVAVYDPAVEVGPWAGSRRPTLTDEAPVEAKMYPRLPGTWEERLRAVGLAVQARLQGPRKASVDDPGRPEWPEVSVRGTYDDRVIATRYKWTIAADGRDSEETWEIPYTIDGTTVTLGEPTPVRLEVVAVPDDDDVDEAAAAAVGDAAAAVKALLHAGIEVKAGRVLSSSNANRLRDAVSHLLAVLSAAGIKVDPPDEPVKPPKPEPDPETGTTAPSARDGDGEVKVLTAAEVAALLDGL